MAKRRTLGLVLFALVALGCSDRAPAVIGDQGAGKDQGKLDLGAGQDRTVSADRPHTDARALDRAVPPDAPPIGPDAGFCGVVCKPGEVHLISACVATDKLFTCTKSCSPGAPSACSATETCESWGGTPCCFCSAAVPACVPQASTGPIKGPLRFSPTSGIAGQKVTITVSGAPFYVGALFYNVRMGSETKMEEGASKPCSIAATFTPPNPGLHVVEVSQYGGGAPWVLAGFYTASGGSIPQPTVQPGDFCKVNPAPGDPACASAPPYSCSCVAGRCVCK